MSSLLTKDALDNVWCVPDPLNQIIVKPGRITPINGTSKYLDYNWNKLSLPNNTSIFHIYQIGQIHPTLIDLFEAGNSWKLLSDACNDTFIVCDIYTSTGIQIPRTRTWYRNTLDKNIIIAVEFNASMKYDFNTSQLYIRLYKNAYFETATVGPNDKVKVGGGVMTSLTVINSLYTEINNIISAPSYSNGITLYINGIKSSVINASTVKVGDIAEYIYDSTIYKVADFHITDLQSFTSILDNKAKLLLHYSDNGDGFIDYIDQIDIFMIDITTQKGVYVHKNAADTLRMVTYKDYSFVSDYLNQYYSNFEDINGIVHLSNLYLRLHIRYSGFQHTPILESNQTSYLMKMSDSEITQAMVGVNSNIDVWKAAQLENSAYTKIMRSGYNDITEQLVESAYGYTHINYILGNSYQPVVVSGGSRTVTVPPAFQIDSTAFEYDINGILINQYSMANNVLIYIPNNLSCVTVEFVEGLASTSLDETYDMVPTLTTDSNNYRYYVKINNQQTGIAQWRDVTNTTYYTNNSGVSNWNNTSLLLIVDRIVRSDKKFLFYQTTINPTDGVLSHQITYNKIVNGTPTPTILPVAMGELDVWLNNKPLVYGIDYNFTFPNILITNKSLLATTPGAQVLTVRFTGFCDSNLIPTPVKESGFVYNGSLSANGIYDLHEGRVQRVVVNGSLKRSDTVSFIESPNSNLLPDGAPYSIRDVVNPLRNLITRDTYEIYQAGLVTEKTVSDYLTLHKPQVLGSPINPITNKYVLYSPFICKIIYDLLNSVINDPIIDGSYPDAFVTGICSSYYNLLALDPINPNNLPDLRYCVIHPHWLATTISLSISKFRFITNVVRIYANGIVNLTPLVQIAP